MGNSNYHLDCIQCKRWRNFLETKEEEVSCNLPPQVVNELDCIILQRPQETTHLLCYCLCRKKFPCQQEELAQCQVPNGLMLVWNGYFTQDLVVFLPSIMFSSTYRGIWCFLKEYLWCSPQEDLDFYFCILCL